MLRRKYKQIGIIVLTLSWILFSTTEILNQFTSILSSDAVTVIRNTILFTLIALIAYPIARGWMKFKED